MIDSVRRSRRYANWALVLLLPVLGGCEDPAEFTEPDHVAFTALAIDKATVRPREGERLTVGPTEYDFEVDLRWQNMPSGSGVGVWLETWDSVSGQQYRWEGDLLEGSASITGASGETGFSGTFTLPEVSPFCGSYDYVRILAVAFPGGDPPPNAAYRDEVFFPVSGSNWTGPCVARAFGIFPGTDYRVGEPIILYGRGLPAALDVSLPGSQQDDNVWPNFVRLPESEALFPVPGTGYVIAFVPVGAQDGRLRAFAGSSEVRYTEAATVTIDVAATQADVFEPNNTAAAATDSIYLGLWDPWSYWGAYGFNPSLTLTGADRTPDALDPQYGQGDWFYVLGVADPTVTFDVCIRVASHLGSADDLDLYVYDGSGAIVAQSASATGTESVRIADVSSSDVYWAWVTPWLAGFTSAVGGYSYEVGPCANATGTAILRPDRPFGFKPSGSSGGSGPAGVAGRDGGDGTVGLIGGGRVPVSTLREQGGDR